MGKTDYDRIASILVEAIYFGDSETAKRWGISTRTIERYRVKLSDDDELSGFVALKKAAFEDEWASEIPSAIRVGIRFLGTAAQEADPKNPEVIHAIAGAVKILAEVGLTKEIIDARLNRNHRQDGKESEPLASLQAGNDNIE